MYELTNKYATASEQELGSAGIEKITDLTVLSTLALDKVLLNKYEVSILIR